MMNKELFENEVEQSLGVLRKGGVILYPTDTVWGIGCDATNVEAVKRIYQIKERDDSKSLIILVSDEREILQYVAGPDPAVFDFIAAQQRPTTIIFQQAIHLPANVVADDGSVAIRLVRDEFCRHLIKRLGKPIVSTSANISGQKGASTFNTVSEEIKERVDYIVNWRQQDRTPAQPSQIIKWYNNGSFQVIRS
jgi:L-threonylcarbamoyladenylate synthase